MCYRSPSLRPLLSWQTCSGSGEHAANTRGIRNEASVVCGHFERVGIRCHILLFLREEFSPWQNVCLHGHTEAYVVRPALWLDLSLVARCKCKQQGRIHLLSLFLAPLALLPRTLYLLDLRFQGRSTIFHLPLRDVTFFNLWISKLIHQSLMANSIYGQKCIHRWKQMYIEMNVLGVTSNWREMCLISFLFSYLNCRCGLLTTSHGMRTAAAHTTHSLRSNHNAGIIQTRTHQLSLSRLRMRIL